MSLFFECLLWHLTFLFYCYNLYIMIFHTSNKAIIVLILIFTTNCKEYFYSPLNLYITDANSSSIFERVAEKRQQIGILFTNKYCRECHLHQNQMKAIISKLWKDYKMPIYRCQLPNNIGLQQQFNIKRFPMLYFVIPHRNSYIVYQNYGIVTVNSAVSIAKKIKYSLQKYDLSQKQRNQGILLNSQKLFFIEQEQMMQQYSLNPIYINLPYLVFLQDRQMQIALNHDEINEHQLSACLLYLKRQKKCFSPTSLHEIAYIFSLINYQQVIEFNEKTYKSYQQLSLDRYIFIAVLDSIFKRQSSENHREMLNKILLKREFRSKITIFWMQTQLNKQKLIHLGFKQTDRPPLFSQFDLTNAPKKILKNKQGNPIFQEESITNFIKNIIKFDQKEQLTKWNQQLLKQSLQRLKISNQYKIIYQNEKIESKTYFVLSFPEIEYELLGDNTVFYKMILNYRYLIERINRFAQNKIEYSYLTFDKYACNKKVNYGLFLRKQSKCFQLSNQIIFSQQQISTNVKALFNLPDFFWVNQDNYQSYLQENYQQLTLVEFTYHTIDI